MGLPVSVFGGLSGHCQYHALDRDAEGSINVSIHEKPAPFLRSESKISELGRDHCDTTGILPERLVEMQDQSV